MVKFSFHIFLSLWLSLTLLASEHYHECSETISIADIADSDAHCDLCTVKLALQSCQVSRSFSVECLFPEFVSFEPSSLSPFTFHASLCLSSRAPPQA